MREMQRASQFQDTTPAREGALGGLKNCSCVFKPKEEAELFDYPHKISHAPIERGQSRNRVYVGASHGPRGVFFSISSKTAPTLFSVLR